METNKNSKFEFGKNQNYHLDKNEQISLDLSERLDGSVDGFLSINGGEPLEYQDVVGIELGRTSDHVGLAVISLANRTRPYEWPDIAVCFIENNHIPTTPKIVRLNDIQDGIIGRVEGSFMEKFPLFVSKAHIKLEVDAGNLLIQNLNPRYETVLSDSYPIGKKPINPKNPIRFDDPNTMVGTRAVNPLTGESSYSRTLNARDISETINLRSGLVIARESEDGRVEKVNSQKPSKRYRIPPKKYLKATRADY